MRIAKNETASIRWIVALCASAVFLAAAVSGCSSVELEEKVFPLFAAVRAEKDSYRILYEPYEEQKQLDYNHLKVMVFEEAFLDNAGAFDALLSDIREMDTYPRNAYVCVTESAEQLVQRDADAEELGDYLEELLEKDASDGGKNLPTLGKLLDEQINRQQTLNLPYLISDGDSVIWDGGYVMDMSIAQSGIQAQEPSDTTEYSAQADDAADPLQPAIAQKILRFHVLANSDSEADQAVKLKVRDAVGERMAAVLKDADNLSASEQIVEKNLEEIRQTAEAVLEQEGYDYGVTARLATAEFPEKTYGAFTFPAGEYEALELVLGNGGGQNWWCVLYPNLCFRGSVYEAADEEAQQALREVLTPEEYADVFNSGRFVIRLKFLEHFRKNS